MDANATHASGRAAGQPPVDRCYNCLAEVTRAYCGECGQKHVPTRRGFLAMASEAIDETMSIDGKLFRTAWGVLTRPGALPAAYWAGQRQRYSSPFRIYVFASLVGFLVLSFSTIAVFGVGAVVRPQLTAETTQEQVEALIASDEYGLILGPDFFIPIPDKSDTVLQHKLRILQATMGREEVPPEGQAILESIQWSLKEPGAFNEQVNQWLSRLLIAFVGVVMVMLMVLFPRRYVVEHFVFAIHLQAFTLLTMSAVVLFSMASGIGSALTFLIFAAVNGVYALMAMKRAYANSWWATALKFLVFAVFYIVAMFIGSLFVLMAAGWSMGELAGSG